MSDPIAIVQAFAELRYGAVVHTRENSVKYGHNLGQTLYISLPHLSSHVSAGAAGVVSWSDQVMCAFEL